MDKTVQKLIENSKASQLACIEIHNKPIFPFRYEVCVILNINAWELLLKAFILEKTREVKIINEDGTSKPFPECLRNVASTLGKTFFVAKENIEKLYEFRNSIVHFYHEDISILLFSLLSKNVLLYHEFLLSYFGIDIANETNLVLLPIGFRKPASPIDFLSNDSSLKDSSPAVQTFIKSIIESTNAISKAGLDDSILFSFKMSLINESRIKNSDIVAAITKDKEAATIAVGEVLGKVILAGDEDNDGVKKIKIEEENIFRKIYTQDFADVVKTSKEIFNNFKQDAKFRRLMESIKKNPKLHKKRFLSLANPRSGSKDYYSVEIYDELSKHYSRT